MKILVHIGHPAHVHFFKNFIWEMEKRGHKIKIVARDKEIALDLLDHYGFRYKQMPSVKMGLMRKMIDLVKVDLKLFGISKDIDVFVCIGLPSGSHVSKLKRKKAFYFTDTENATLANKLASPFCTNMITPSCFSKEFGKKQIRYNGYHELAYLHPNRFKPDPKILDELGVDEDERFTIIRFVSWQATHDIAHSGISLKNKIKAAKEFSKYGRVFITSEKKLPKELRKFQISIPPHRIHHAMYYATLLYGESATMASECAVLGTPSIYIDNDGRGYTFEEEKEFGAVFNFTESISDQRKSIKKGIELLKKSNVKKEWVKKSKRLVKKKIDVTSFMIWFVENHPKSAKVMISNPEYQERFK